MKYEHTDFSKMGAFLQSHQMTDECNEQFNALVETHKQFLTDFGGKDALNPMLHHLIFCLADNKIIGFRYFYLSPDQEQSELFAIHVDQKYRRNGIASEMIRKSIRISNGFGAHHFTIRIASKTDERDGLFRLYKKIAEEQRNNIFEIHYDLNTFSLNFDAYSPRT